MCWCIVPRVRGPVMAQLLLMGKGLLDPSTARKALTRQKPTPSHIRTDRIPNRLSSGVHYDTT